MEGAFPGYISDFMKDEGLVINPNQLRWNPQEYPTGPTKFLDGIRTLCGAGEPSLKSGISIHLFAFNTSMKDEAFYNSDGDMLFVPQEGTMRIITENGKLQIHPKEIAVV